MVSTTMSVFKHRLPGNLLERHILRFLNLIISESYPEIQVFTSPPNDFDALGEAMAKLFVKSES